MSAECFSRYTVTLVTDHLEARTEPAAALSFRAAGPDRPPSGGQCRPCRVFIRAVSGPPRSHSQTSSGGDRGPVRR